MLDSVLHVDHGDVLCCPMQLLTHGADVHNPGARSYQTPLRMAVTDLDMDVDMVDMLVSHGASPFLEANDGKHTCAAHCCIAVCGLNVPRLTRCFAHSHAHAT